MVQKELFDPDIVEVQSHTTPGVTYKVNKREKTCTCMAFQKRGKWALCKHLNQVLGGNVVNYAVLSSGLVKSLRLRRVTDAQWFLKELWKDKKQRWRTCRRMVVNAFEDGLDVATQIVAMQEAAGAYQERVPETMEYLVDLICHRENWWQSESGQTYIHTGTLAERVKAQSTPAGLSAILKAGYGPQTTLNHYYGLKSSNVSMILDAIDASGVSVDDDLGALMTVCRKMPTRLVKSDENIECQLLYRAAGGPLSADPIEPYAKPVPDGFKVPDWVYDGMHCGGGKRDSRFAGTWRNMIRAIAAFQHYGRLDPADIWTQEIWDADV